MPLRCGLMMIRFSRNIPALPLAIIVTFILPLACLPQRVMTSPSRDFSTTGFISDDCYQLASREAPDPRAQGLVERRDSAFFKAREALVPAAVNRLTDYRMSRIPPAKNGKSPEEMKKKAVQISTLIRRICEDGRISEEFYEDDDSVILIFRICRKGLKKEIESLPSPL